MTVAARAPALRAVWPLLTVQNIEASLHFYRDQLGFAEVGRAESDGRLFWCRVARGGSSIMLQQWDPEDGPIEGRGRGVSLYFLCDDVESLYAELTAHGIRLDPPQTQDYGMKQIFVPEPDGYFICFESETVPS